ncbi:MAG: GGDEF domain-containing protein [Pseudomonadota bacterium]|nr:GGDEF domain-containing protein [Pseudomonadota bacterium]
MRELDGALGPQGYDTLPRWLEQRFQAETADRQAQALFRASLGAAVFYNAQLFAEWSLTPDAFRLAAALHFGLVTPALLAIAAFARSALTPLRRDLLGFAIPTLILVQATITYFASASEGSPYYIDLLAVIGILANSSLPLSSRASLWSTALCLALLALLVRAPHGAPTHLYAGSLIPIVLCVMMTLHSAFERNHEARRSYLLDLRHRLRIDEVGAEARHDPLTGLANRRRLEEVAEGLWTKDSGHVSPVSIILYDVDRFKSYNDLYGHQAGDDCLRQVAACALAEIGAEDDVAARYGGEEFILLLPRTPLEEARRAAERLRAAVAALRIPHAGGEELGVVSASFGVACADSAACGFAALTAEADAALYRAKRGGRNRVIAATGAPKGPKAA